MIENNAYLNMMTSDDSEFVIVGFNGKIKFLGLKEGENNFHIVAEYDIFDLFQLSSTCYI